MTRRITIGGRSITDRKTVTSHPLPREQLGAFAEAEYHNRRRYDFAAVGDTIMIHIPDTGYTFEWRVDHAPVLGEYGIAQLPDSPALPRPPGCASMFYVFRPINIIRNDYSSTQECWYATELTAMRSLVDMVYRADTMDFPDSIHSGHMMSASRRPVTKVRFPSSEYFIPCRNILYKGYVYR